LILKLIMGYCEIESKDYMIIAGYGLRCVRPSGDLDIGVNKEGFEKIKKKKVGELGVAKISGHERVFIKIPEIDEEAEIEIFELENRGFPIDDFSLVNLRKKRGFEMDEYGNQYFNVMTLADFYSTVGKREGKYYMGEFEIKKERLEKNISHLTLLHEHLKKCGAGELTSEEMEVCECLKSKKNKKLGYLKGKIEYLKELL
jgi:hypothetical protein